MQIDEPMRTIVVEPLKLPGEPADRLTAKKFMPCCGARM
jgi:hypothetical protein